MPVNKKRWLKRALWVVLIMAATAVTFAVYANHAVSADTEAYLYSDTSVIPCNKAGLLLGTSQYLQNGRENLYFRYRMEAAFNLYQSGKIRYLILSGDNSHRDYNEPEAMRQALLKLGIPDSIMYSDYAGFRTFDSVIRGRYIFGQDSITIISQPFHNARAVYIARQKGMHAIGYNARDVSKAYGFKVTLREYLARANMMLDLYLLRTKPKFLGEKIKLKS